MTYFSSMTRLTGPRQSLMKKTTKSTAGGLLGSVSTSASSPSSRALESLNTLFGQETTAALHRLVRGSSGTIILFGK
jgi:hypothetical protein